jgi:hypothetical protein
MAARTVWRGSLRPGRQTARARIDRLGNRAAGLSCCQYLYLNQFDDGISEIDANTTNSLRGRL